MIIDHGIDLQGIDIIERAYEKNNRFAKRVLTDKEFQCFSEQENMKRRMELLAERWTAKEAFAKAMGIGIRTLGSKDVETLSSQLGAPVITRSPFSGKCFISLSYTGSLVQASVVLEDNSWTMRLKRKHSKNSLALEEIK